MAVEVTSISRSTVEEYAVNHIPFRDGFIDRVTITHTPVSYARIDVAVTFRRLAHNGASVEPLFDYLDHPESYAVAQAAVQAFLRTSKIPKRRLFFQGEAYRLATMTHEQYRVVRAAELAEYERATAEYRARKAQA